MRMMTSGTRAISTFCSLLIFTASSLWLVQGQQSETDTERAIDIEHAECAYFGPKYQKQAEASRDPERSLSALTQRVTRLLPARQDERNSTEAAPRNAAARGAIDQHLFTAMQEAGVTPAEPSSDFEFIRRVTLDLTGRIPVADRVLAFIADSSPDKRSKLIDELLGRPEWIDKWTMYFGDLLANTAFSTTTSIRRYPEGRNAFYGWIKKAISENRRYDQIAAEIISAQASNSYDPAQGQINWIVNGLVTNGPAQDTFDQQAANVADTFLGLNHLNCILCHNGRGHLDSLSLWGKSATRVQAWGMAAYFSKTSITRAAVNPAAGNQPYYWRVSDNPAGREYQLNTTTGNRPARCLNGLTPGDNGRCLSIGIATPEYIFNGNKPAAGENYRAALAREITSDIQFARATVNYIWKEFFGRGIVDPVNQFDPARLDPDNPPPQTWALQPSNARLLNMLASDFVINRYDLKALMRQIANSEAYQLSARYQGEWNPNHEKLFARKLVRRLWAEELHDAIAQSSNIVPSYNLGDPSGRISWAMQFPESRGMPDGINGRVAAFLDSFLRGNRDDEDRRPDGSLSQALTLMNDPFVTTRIRATGPISTGSLLQKSLGFSDERLVENLFLNVLSRYPSAAEKQAALSNLSSGNRTQKAEDLLWSLYNKVDFLFNY